MDEIKQKYLDECLDDIKGLFENYMQLVADLSRMGSNEVIELDIDEPLIKIMEGIGAILNRFYDIKIKKIKEKREQNGAVSGIINEEGERKWLNI